MNRPRGEWPEMMSVDEWEVKALEYYEERSRLEDLPASPPPAANHNDVTHRYKPHVFMHGTEVRR
ncbi:hypothetical protein [Cupriavidus sp. BIS7]|uniref:hypothetical protein n=1 Tax=Cupriavidus sp. BIS7 TaxID=1217718 RepID=UPI0012F6F531|nr:hypothetical protein [Cupriavidus sp. BIS7]